MQNPREEIVANIGRKPAKWQQRKFKKYRQVLRFRKQISRFSLHKKLVLYTPKRLHLRFKMRFSVASMAKIERPEPKF